MLRRKNFASLVLIFIYVSVVFAKDVEPVPLGPKNTTKPIPTQRPAISQNTTPKFVTTTTKSTTANVVTENPQNQYPTRTTPIIELTTSFSTTKPIPTQRPAISQNTTPKFVTTTTISTTANVVTENPQSQYPTRTTPIIELTTSFSTTKPIPTQRPVISQNTTPKFVTTTTTAKSTTTKPQNQYPTMNWKPFYPSTQVQNCYFVKQREKLRCYWTWLGLRWTYRMDCYYCCECDSMFAGCNQVHHSYCDSCY